MLTLQKANLDSQYPLKCIICCYSKPFRSNSLKTKEELRSRRTGKRKAITSNWSFIYSYSEVFRDHRLLIANIYLDQNLRIAANKAFEKRFNSPRTSWRKIRNLKKCLTELLNATFKRTPPLLTTTEKQK